MRSYSQPLLVPFPGLGRVGALTIDPVGGLVVTDMEFDENAPPGMGITKWARLSRIAPDGGDPVVFDFPGLAVPDGVAVGADATLYVADNRFGTVLAVLPGNGTPTLFPTVGEDRKPAGVAVGPDGAVYAIYQPGFIRGEGQGGVVKLAQGKSLFGKSKHTVLPIAVRFPRSIAVDAAGAVYVVDSNTVLRWRPGDSAASTLPFTGLANASHVAVDSTGSVYVTDQSEEGRVFILDQATGEQNQLPVGGLKYPTAIAVDAAGTVYLADNGNHRLVRVPLA